MNCEVHVMGLGVENSLPLSDASRAVLEQADAIYGTSRQAQLAGVDPDRVQAYPSPFANLWLKLQQVSGTVVLLASGDPLFFGIGTSLKKALPDLNVQFHPHISSVQALCARLGIGREHIQPVSLHGRPMALLNRYLRKNRQLVCFTDADNSPAEIAKACVAAGFGESRMVVAENLGMADECLTECLVSEWDDRQTVSPLNLVYLETRGAGGVQPEFPGVPDEAFSTDGQPGKGMISKREVRVLALSLMNVGADEVVWDVGAGCGGMAVELALWQPRAQVHALELNPERVAHIRTNQARFGVVDNLHITAGRAPDDLAAWPEPDKVFVGGSDGVLAEVLDLAWLRLKSGGRLVVTAVTEETLAELKAFASDDAKWTRLDVSRQESLGRQTVMRPKLPVTLMWMDKP